MAPIQLVVLAVALVVLSAPPLRISDLAGQSPDVVAQSVGAPLYPTTSFASDGEPLSISEAVYALEDGGRLEVTYCRARAAAFLLRTSGGMRTAESLLGRSGIPPGQLVLRERGAGYLEWGPAERRTREGVGLIRVLATMTQHGWTDLSVDYGSAC